MAALPESKENSAWTQPLKDAKGLAEFLPNFDNEQAQADANALRKAMKGFGTNEAEIIRVTGGRNHVQRMAIKQAFSQLHNRDLIKDLKSELSGKFEDLVVGLWMEPGEFNARQIKKACDGMGTNEDLLTEVICTKNNSELTEMKQAWATVLKEKKTLYERVEGETSKNFRTLLLSLLECKRPANKEPNPDHVKADAEELNRLLSQNKASEIKAKFIEIFTARSFAHVAAISGVFQEISKKYTMSAAIKKSFSGDTSNALVTINEYCTQPYDYFAALLRKSMKGAGTNDALLIRTIVSRHEIDLDNIRKIFGQRHGDGKTLNNWIQGDTGGDYRRLLKKLCGYD